MKNRRNYYRILHVQPDAPREVIRSSYRAMMQGLRMHPDLGGDDGNAALINEAYAVLTDPGQRAAYDSARQNPEWARGSENEPVSAGDPAPTPRHRCAFCGARHAWGKHAPADVFCASCQSPLSLAEYARIKDGCRRDIMRIPNDQPLNFFTHWPQPRPFAGRMDDLSLNGMKFRSNTSLELGQTIKIDSRILRAVGRVTHRQERGRHRDIGVQFISLCFEETQGTFVTERA
jgi:curved DNA-binding protein CbpA